jgi:DNA repair photolyase
MQYKQIKTKILLNKVLKKDPLFYGDYTIDPYQNCEFGCKYCDSSFDETIYIKSNAAEILNHELETSKKGRIIVGSVHDPYQKIEGEEKITRRLLEIIKDYGFSCHILTKSNLVLRDIDIISKIPDCLVTLSIISLKESIYNLFEKNVCDTKIRLQTIKKLNDSGIKSGIALIPILPFIVEEELKDIIKFSKKHKAKYLLYKHLELKGDQKKFFIDLIKKIDTDLPKKYSKLYNDSFMPNEDYLTTLNKTILDLCKKYRIKNRI